MLISTVILNALNSKYNVDMPIQNCMVVIGGGGLFVFFLPKHTTPKGFLTACGENKSQWLETLQILLWNALYKSNSSSE